MSPMRVLVADDGFSFRQIVAAVLRKQPDMQIVGEAADGREAVALARRLHPDVILMDIVMPELNGAEATAAILADNPAACVIGLSSLDDEDAEAIVTAGAKARLNKHLLLRDLPVVMRRAALSRAA